MKLVTTAGVDVNWRDPNLSLGLNAAGIV
jgi:hypothetical protein